MMTRCGLDKRLHRLVWEMTDEKIGFEVINNLYAFGN